MSTVALSVRRRVEAVAAVALLVPRFAAYAQASQSLTRFTVSRQPRYGSFAAAGMREWAILCSVRDTSQILVYRVGSGGTGRVVDSLLPAADRAWMQGIGGGRWGYSRLLQILPRPRIRAWRTDADRHAIPQPVDHDAIEQIFLGKGAEGFYYAGGRWYRRVTAD